MMGAVLRQVPLAILFGVFLYMGIVSMTGVQLFERVELLFMPMKHHPQKSYVRHVSDARGERMMGVGEGRRDEGSL